MHKDPSLEKIEQRYNDGDFFAAYDLAASALRDRKGCPEIARMAVLSLANVGAIQRAENAFLDFGLHRIHTLDMLSLAGRLAKDRAFQSTSKRQAMLQKAGTLQARMRSHLSRRDVGVSLVFRLFGVVSHFGSRFGPTTRQQSDAMHPSS